MKQQTGEEVRNQLDKEKDSQEQVDKMKKHEDVEPQAENWNPRAEENQKQSKS
ncbi:hypothetical protein M3231_20880 [Neobacillus mesonae]|nr:hypothetical protein [Neobacillus mesonae]